MGDEGGEGVGLILHTDEITELLGDDKRINEITPFHLCLFARGLACRGSLLRFSATQPLIKFQMNMNM